ncbi:DUF6261 family protein [Aquimarina sp. 2-A2]|uniref:DUF6261 family protein n=1 Tax=Aquimarina sp. 2-A2 TaxID=3382644 RepID=UPI00387F05F9
MITIPMQRAYRNSEFIQFHANVLSIVTDADPEKLKIADQVKAYSTPVTALDDVFKQQTSSPTTKELEAYDEARDFAIIGIRAVIEGYTYHFDKKSREAAQALLESIDLYGARIYKLNYQAQTTTLRNLISEWEQNATLKKAVTLLQLTDWIAHMKTVNTVFNTKFLERNSEYATTNKENLSTMRDEAVTAYRVLMDHITAHATLNSSAALTNLINKLNALTDNYNTLIENRTRTKPDAITDIDVDVDNPTPNDIAAE